MATRKEVRADARARREPPRVCAKHRIPLITGEDESTGERFGPLCTECWEEVQDAPDMSEWMEESAIFDADGRL